MKCSPESKWLQIVSGRLNLCHHTPPQLPTFSTLIPSMRLQVCDRASVIPYFPHTHTHLQTRKMNGLIATIWFGVHAPDKIIFQLMIYGATTRWQYRRPTELSPAGCTAFPSDGSTVGGEEQESVNMMSTKLSKPLKTARSQHWRAWLYAIHSPRAELQTKKNSCILSGALPNKHQPESSTVASKQQGTTQTYRCHIAINFAEHSVVIFREF